MKDVAQVAGFIQNLQGHKFVKNSREARTGENAYFVDYQKGHLIHKCQKQK